MTKPAEPIQLLLDEMFPPIVAEALRERGHKVLALVERPRQHVGPLVNALDAWLAEGTPEPPIIEDRLQQV